MERSSKRELEDKIIDEYFGSSTLGILTQIEDEFVLGRETFSIRITPLFRSLMIRVWNDILVYSRHFPSNLIIPDIVNNLTKCDRH